MPLAPELAALIGRIESFTSLPAGGRERILSLAKPARLAKGDFFLRAGEVPTKVGFMIEGWLRYFHVDAEGCEYVRYFCCGGNFVAAQTALAAAAPSEYSIQALEDCSLAIFLYRDWLGLLETHPAWGLVHKAVLDQALASSEQRERSLILEDAASRYARLLAEFPGIEDHVRQYDIAAYLGISPVSLSRIRAETRRNEGELS
jgi:CRP-like cAMP-binding protein